MNSNGNKGLRRYSHNWGRYCRYSRGRSDNGTQIKIRKRQNSGREVIITNLWKYVGRKTCKFQRIFTQTAENFTYIFSPIHVPPNTTFPTDLNTTTHFDILSTTHTGDPFWVAKLLKLPAWNEPVVLFRSLMSFETALPFNDLLMWCAYSESVDVSDFESALVDLCDWFFINIFKFVHEASYDMNLNVPKDKCDQIAKQNTEALRLTRQYKANTMEGHCSAKYIKW